MNTEELYAVRKICDLVEQLWSVDRWLKRVVDDETQWQLITARRATVCYPDYLEIVGPPSSQDYDDTGQLTASRKAELLLYGWFKLAPNTEAQRRLTEG